MKGICPECGEVVRACKLVVPRSVSKGVGESYLCAPHEGKVGYKSQQVISESTGEVVETMCHGSMRIPTSLIKVH